MNRFINTSFASPELFLRHVPLWDWQINGYPVIVIMWNVLLAALALWLTYYLTICLQDKKTKTGRIVWVALAWLFMAPNTAYLMTDARHIIGYCPWYSYGNVCPENAWMTLFFFAFGALGWITFVWTIRPVVKAIRIRFGELESQLFLGVIFPLCGLGLLLGLVNRWNSWEIITNPLGILATASYYMADLTYLKNWLIITVLLAALYWAGARLFVRAIWEKK